MKMDGKLFLSTARFLRNKGSDEAAYRSAISRAYYACFLEARQVAFKNCHQDFRVKGRIKNVRKIGHEPLLCYLKNSELDNIRSIGEDLAGLYENRRDADYDMDEVISENDAHDAIEHAQAFFDNFFQVSPDKIGQAMEEYIKKTFQ